jgi:hypothetical protein
MASTHFSVRVIFKPVHGRIVALLSLTAMAQPYRWQAGPSQPDNALQQRIAPPPGFVRVPLPEGSFGEWLRGLPLKPPGAPVFLFSGALKNRQDVHAAVVDIDVGHRDLQQCADAVMRFRAEWLFSQGRAREVAFNNTAGKRLRFADRRSTTYPAFRQFMTEVFVYAGTASLERELKPVLLKDIEPGDVFIKGGYPGHAVLVADVVSHPENHERKFLLIQSYMPAQEPHVLKSPDDGQSPWFSAPKNERLVTPEWVFKTTDLRRWP